MNSLNWPISFSDLFLTGQTKRREGLIPFPRVGKRADKKPEDISIMWFDPKLMGRDFRRPILDLEDQYIISLLRGKIPSIYKMGCML